MRRLPLLFPFFVLVGCGGVSPTHPNTDVSVPIKLVASDPGTTAFAGTATVPAGTNATPGVLSLASARRFSASGGPLGGDGTLGFGYADANRHTLALQVQSNATLQVGATVSLGDGATLKYEEDGTGYAFRTWSAEGGSLVVDEITDDAVKVHVTGARMVPGDETRGGDFPTTKDSAKGEFTFDLQTTLPRAKGSIDFTSAAGATFGSLTVKANEGTLTAYSSATELDLSASESSVDGPARGRSLLVQILPTKRSVAVGDVFAIDGRQNVASAVDYGSDGSHIWKAASGTATVKAIVGRTVTVELAGLSFVPQERAQGTLAASGTITVLVP